jgi:hypothetical protein
MAPMFLGEQDGFMNLYLPEDGTHRLMLSLLTGVMNVA